MKLNQRIYTIYGYLTIRSKKYSALGNKVVWVGVDENGNQHDITDDILRDPPKKKTKQDKKNKEHDDNLKSAFSHMQLIKGTKGESGTDGATPQAGIDYYTKKQVERIITDLIQNTVRRITDKEIETALKKATPINGVDYFDGKNGYTPVMGKDYLTKAQLKKFVSITSDLAQKNVRNGRDGTDGANAEFEYKWEGTKLYIKKNGKWGEGIDLRGMDGLAGGGGIQKIDDATDVNVKSPADNQALVWDADANQWKNKDQSGAGGGVDTSGTPADNDFAKFTDSNTLEGRSYSETREDLDAVEGDNIKKITVSQVTPEGASFGDMWLNF
jgi:hypothetical protein